MWYQEPLGINNLAFLDEYYFIGLTLEVVYMNSLARHLTIRLKETQMMTS